MLLSKNHINIPYAKGKNVVDFPVAIGMEIEVEGAEYCITRPASYFWKEVGEGSLRDHGREYISIVPVSGHMIETSLESLFYIFSRRPGTKVSTRCGMHVHVNILGLTDTQFRDLLFYNTICEKFIFMGLPKVRGFSPFCGEASESEMYVEDIINFIYSPTDNYLENLLGKYKGINYTNYNTLGTIEYRSFPSVLDVPTLLKYVNVCISIRKYAYENPITDIRNTCNEIINKLKEDPTTTIFSIIGEDYIDKDAHIFNNLIEKTSNFLFYTLLNKEK